MEHAHDINAIFRALSDPTRRAILERLIKEEEATVAQLTATSGVTQGAVSQHLKTLRQAGLVAERPEGRNVHYRAQTAGLEPLYDWMGEYGVFWRDRFASLRGLLKEIDP
jgi:DNA-binding transcriptional ArsR family regulator